MFLQEHVLSIHQSATQDLGAGVEQPFNCFVIQNCQDMCSMGRSMDCTMKGNMVDNPFFCSTFRSHSKGNMHLCKQERKRPTLIWRRLSQTHPIFGRSIPRGWVPTSGMKVQSLIVLSNHSAFLRWSAQSAALLLLLDELMNCCTRQVQMGVSIWDTVHSHSMGQVSAEWSCCPGLMARHARDSVSCSQLHSTGWIPVRIGRLSADVGRIHPVTAYKASLMTGSMRRVWAQQHQAGAQYSAIGTGPRWLLATLLPQPEPANRFRVRCVSSAFCKVVRCIGDTWASCPMLLRSFWDRSKRAGFCCWSWLLAHVQFPCCWDGRLPIELHLSGLDMGAILL